MRQRETEKFEILRNRVIKEEVKGKWESERKKYREMKVGENSEQRNLRKRVKWILINRDVEIHIY